MQTRDETVNKRVMTVREQKLGKGKEVPEKGNIEGRGKKMRTKDETGKKRVMRVRE